METCGLKEKYTILSEFLNEKQRRLYLGVEARSRGYGGISFISRETGVSRIGIKLRSEKLELIITKVPSGTTYL